MDDKKTVMITGAGGYFAWTLIHELKENTDYHVIAMTSDQETTADRYAGFNIICLSNKEVFSNPEYLKHTDILIHTAFCRKSNGKNLVESLRFSKTLFSEAMKNGVKKIINLSSQSVYGQDKGNLPDETMSMNPRYLYALAKAANEVLIEGIMEAAKGMIDTSLYTNIRLASLIGVNVSVPDDIINKFVDDAIYKKTIRIIGGNQKFSFLDIKDAANAVCKLVQKENIIWKREYNLGNSYQVNIMEIAQEVNFCLERLGLERAKIILNPSEIQLNSGMNCERIYRELDWLPQYSFHSSVMDYVRYKAELKRKAEEKSNAEN